MRTIFHVDMDAFFVSVEELFDPGLKHKPVVVGGQAHERGVVSAASYAARQFGVHSAMPLRTAYKLCPHAIFLDGHPERYRDCSRQVRLVLESFSPLVEMASIDEAYLDMTGTARLHGPPLAAAHAVHAAIARATQLNCSIGIGTSRLIAKIGSDQAKPHGILQVWPGAEAAFLAPLPVRKIPGVGAKTEQRLRDLGVTRVRDLTQLGPRRLERELGAWGTALAGKALGEDAGGWFDAGVGRRDAAKSISHEHTFTNDTADPALLEATLGRLSQMVGRRLREQGVAGRTIQLKLRNSAFETITRAHTLARPTNLDPPIWDAIRDLFRANWRAGTAVRLLGVQVASFETEAPQHELFDRAPAERWRDATRAADKLRDRFGDGVVGLGGALGAHFREKSHEAMPLHKEKTEPNQ